MQKRLFFLAKQIQRTHTYTKAKGKHMQFFLPFSFCKFELLQRMKTHKNHTSPEMMKAFHMPRFSHHQSVLAMCNWRSLCSLSIRVISSFSLETICRGRFINYHREEKAWVAHPVTFLRPLLRKAKRCKRPIYVQKKMMTVHLYNNVSLKDQLQY